MALKKRVRIIKKIRSKPGTWAIHLPPDVDTLHWHS